MGELHLVLFIDGERADDPQTQAFVNKPVDFVHGIRCSTGHVSKFLLVNVGSL